MNFGGTPKQYLETFKEKGSQVSLVDTWLDILMVSKVGKHAMLDKRQRQIYICII